MKNYIFESLENGELKTGTELNVFCKSHNIDSTLINNCSVQKFRDEIEDLTFSINLGESIIINIECHGLDDKTGLKFTDGNIYWNELYNLLYGINKKIGMKLIVLFSACHGAYFYKSVTLAKGCPFYKFFGPDNEIKGVPLLETNKKIMAKIFNYEEFDFVIECLNKMLLVDGVKFIYFDSVQLFRKAYSKYINESLALDVVKQRIESHITLFESYSKLSCLNNKPHQNVKYFKKMYGDGLFQKDALGVKYIEQLERFLMITDSSFFIYELFDYTFDDIITENCFDSKKVEWSNYSKNL